MKRVVVDLNTMEKISPAFRGARGHWLAKKAINLFAIDKVNKVYESSCDHSGADFAASLLNDLGVFYKVGDADRLKHLPEGAFITISNHPYGGLDGIMLIDLMAGIRPDYKLMVNSVLSLIETMRENFISVKPVGNKKNANVSNVRGVRTTLSHLQEGHPMGFFPSGAVSNFIVKDMRLKDREWQESVLRLIQGAKVPIVPIRFLDRNSTFFYFLGLISWRVRSLRMPYEVFNKGKQNPRIAIGNILTLEEQEQFADVKSFGKYLRKSIYEMPKPASYTPRIIPNLKGKK